ncbi:hypothetical protein OIE13_33695 [Streptosporangium sp. NBC_01810]|uniref:hypothetical protein n=1 Tax=Streptosporangium sp. NBC_01810 TaxID=2975951 RepID=UPI002DDA55B7|nr:hypothetical protein [Streptosporangium sp. NBC_01810]WSA25803.1 hypothetical protein OIE13_33695 [Streptosporangium sp. NBC_01810]
MRDNLSRAVDRCLTESGLTHGAPGPLAASLAGIGTTAPHAVSGGLLHDAMERLEIKVTSALAYPSPDDLVAAGDWDLALVLSPWKKAVSELVTEITPTASATGVIDTIVRNGGYLTGVNTNGWAAWAAMDTLLAGHDPAGVLVLGSGGSAGSVAHAVRRAWPRARLVGSARDAAALAAWAERYGAEAVAPADLDRPADLIVNTTTWGETEDSERNPFAFPFEAIAAPGGRLFDLNNRTSALQGMALRAGMSVMSGTYMQRVTNACRAALVKARAEAQAR